jgi:RHH-type proline utilization regulon transcriptional repressor/proline dehydrogenase/delta 1-pyrroline-5-carboxylate dehydrogenase
VLQFQNVGEAVPVQANGSATTATRLAPASRADSNWSDALREWARSVLGPSELVLLEQSLASYVTARDEHFRKEHTEFALLGEDNVFRYLPCKRVAVFASERARPLDVLRAAAAALLSDVELTLVLAPEFVAHVPGTPSLASAPLRTQTVDELAASLTAAGYERVRWLGDAQARPAEVLLQAAAGAGCYIASQRVVWQGRYELLRYHREQAISVDYHRYGHRGWKALVLESGAPALHSRAPSTNSNATFSPSGPAARGP